MLTKDMEYHPVYSLKETPGYFMSRAKALLILLAFVSLVIVLIVLAVMLAQQKGTQGKVCESKDDPTDEKSSLSPLSCDVVVVGGGISGLYMAETLMRRKKEHDVCLFEKDSRFGGKNYDVAFKKAQNVSLSMGAWRVNTAHKKTLNLAERLNISMLKMPPLSIDYLEGRGIYADNHQSFKEKAFPTLMSTVFANMTPSQMFAFAWRNMSKEKALEYPSYHNFLCQRVGSEGCAFLDLIYGIKMNYNMERSTLTIYDIKNGIKSTSEYVRPRGGLSEIVDALAKSVKRFGVRMYAKEAVSSINRDGEPNTFVVRTEHYLVSAKKVIVAIPFLPLKEINGDIAFEIKNHAYFTPIIGQKCFKAVAIYKHPWWENATSIHNMSLKTWKRYVSSATCLMYMMPYSRGPQGEGIIQLSYNYFDCAVKWGQLSKLPRATFLSELNKAVQAVFPGMVVPKPLDVKFKYWEACWHYTKAGSNVSRQDTEEWAKRPFPGEEIYIVGEAFAVSVGWNEGALQTAYKALKEGWGIEEPEP
ncbi:amine oxidase [flavin-containing] B-like [Porites lutea]|uniref:amine oxidase [flavin-containing] B-like n=1 Tax=Porites lutea TaxID=51062 RepID=UPI003CC68D94